MTFSLLTYNVLFNQAFFQLQKILTEYRPDILCFQEVDTSVENLSLLEKFGYKLADYSNSLIKFSKVYGIATYYNPKTIILTDTDSFDLPKSLYEMVSTVFKILRGGVKPRTILKTNFQLKSNHQRIAVYNVHLSLFGINRTRTKQLEIILNHELNDHKIPTIITGDFNYFPYRRKKLEILMTNHGFKEATSNIHYTFRILDRKFARYNWVQSLGAILVKKYFYQRLKPDYTFYKGSKLVNSERIEKEFSDHYPIISTFKID